MVTTSVCGVAKISYVRPPNLLGYRYPHSLPTTGALFVGYTLHLDADAGRVTVFFLDYMFPPPVEVDTPSCLFTSFWTVS